MNSLTKHSSIVLLLLISQATSFAQIQVGDTLDFWSVSYIDWQPDSISQRSMTAVCNKVGESCYFFIATAVTQTPSQQQIDDLVKTFDTAYAQNLTAIYGPIPDEFDNDPRVFILLVEPEGWTGYFDPAQQMADSLVFHLWGKHSTEREMIYLSVDAFLYNVAPFVLAHEFGHLLHWARDHSPEPPNDPKKYWEDAWIDEAFAMFAGIYLTEDLTVPGVMDYGAFFATTPDLPLTHFVSDLSYDQTKLWLSFMYEHYGKLDFISTLIREQANGIVGVRNTLSNLGYVETFEESFQQWVLANYLDDESYEHGKYSYHHYNFPRCRVTATHVAYPTGLKVNAVSAFAADYVVFHAISPKPVTISFIGDSASIFRLSIIFSDFRSNEVRAIYHIPLDSLNQAAFSADSFGVEYDRIIMVVMNVDSYLAENASAQYSYSADVKTGIEADHGFALDERSLLSYSLALNYPNPFNSVTTIGFCIPRWSYEGADWLNRRLVTVTIYNAAGEKVTTLVSEHLSAGSYKYDWEANGLASGVYFYKLEADQFTQTRKMLLVQ